MNRAGDLEFEIQDLDSRGGRLVRGTDGEPDLIELNDGAKLYVGSPRDQYVVSCWFFNQLIYSRVAREIDSPVLPVQVCRLGDAAYLCNEFLENWSRLDAAGAYQGKHAKTRIDVEGYNVTWYYDCLQSEKLELIAGQLLDLLITDQLLWMLDRTPDNVLGYRESNGKFSKILGVDHEHCLAPGLIEGSHQPSPTSVQQTCHPTQMSHLLKEVSLDVLNAKGLAAREKVRPELFNLWTSRLVAMLCGLPNIERSILCSHAAAANKLFAVLWDYLPGKLRDFHNSYAPKLRECRVKP